MRILIHMCIRLQYFRIIPASIHDADDVNGLVFFIYAVERQIVFDGDFAIAQPLQAGVVAPGIEERIGGQSPAAFLEVIQKISGGLRIIQLPGDILDNAAYVFVRVF